MDAAKHEITLKCLDLEVLYHHLAVVVSWLAGALAYYDWTSYQPAQHELDLMIKEGTADKAVKVLGGDNDIAPIMEDYRDCLAIIAEKTKVNPVRCNSAVHLGPLVTPKPCKPLFY